MAVVKSNGRTMVSAAIDSGMSAASTGDTKKPNGTIKVIPVKSAVLHWVPVYGLPQSPFLLDAIVPQPHRLAVRITDRIALRFMMANLWHLICAKSQATHSFMRATGITGYGLVIARMRRMIARSCNACPRSQT